MSLVLLGLALASTLLAPPAAASQALLRPGSPGLPRKALWVTRFDYRTEEDVCAAIDAAAKLGFDTVLFQVRGNGTVFYESAIEPWAEQLGWRDPGFDPLQVAIDRAHARGLALHAWVNVVPGWWGQEPPARAEHLYYKRPEWFWYDQHGKRQALSERFYVSLNPCLPGVRAYLTSVMVELCANYRIDGLHLDYLRFPNEPPAVPAGSGLDYPRDPGSITLFRRATGGTPDGDPPGWDRWRCEQVTRLLREIRAGVRRTSPDLILSAAVGPDPERALEHFQDTRTWLKEGLLDGVFPMNYTADEALFAERLELWRDLARDAHLVMGTMITGGAGGAGGDGAASGVAGRTRQVATALGRVGAVAVFAWSGLFDPGGTGVRRPDEQGALRARRRHALEAVFRGAAAQ